MGNKIHRIETINDVVNLITEENAEFLINDLVDSLRVLLSIKEKMKKETGEYPIDFFGHIDIVFDGKGGVNKLTVNGKDIDLNKL
jgi:hypothetical protein